MSEYATPTNNDSFFLDPRRYWQISGLALAAVALLGIVVDLIFAGNSSEGIANFLQFDRVHNILHVVLAATALTLGFGRFNGGILKTMAIVFGFVYVGLAVIGFIGGLSYDLFNLGLLQLELGENLVHLLIGSWALITGFTARYD